MKIREQILSRGLKHVLDGQKSNTCYMLDEHGREIPITKAMVVTVCQQLLQHCRNIKN